MHDALKAAKDKNVLKEVTTQNEKISFRIVKPNSVKIREANKPGKEPSSQKTTENRSTEESDFQQFKRHIWGVVATLQAEVQGLKDSHRPSAEESHPIQHDSSILYESLIACLEGRVKTLENELKSKQTIIESLLSQNIGSHQQQIESTNHHKSKPRESAGVQLQIPKEPTKKTEKLDTKAALKNSNNESQSNAQTQSLKIRKRTRMMLGHNKF
eukprot:Seg6393.1 transcript_id=Seg6393.1/GoldUCD/mRNA.D3Y31 product="hypothetical protein" protein_id=Seg6393.1/GoldUCD/D3Y31